MNIKIKSILAFYLVLLIANFECAGQGRKKTEGIFPKGKLGPAENFTGNAWNIGLIADNTLLQTVVGNVYFEPGARSNWHTHPAGQILVITDGEGYHQIKGQPKQHLRKGDVVNCPPNVQHWHGAGPKTGMQQMYILPHTEKGLVYWLQPVTDMEYLGTK